MITMVMVTIAALSISISMLFAQQDRAPLHNVIGIHISSLPDITRITVDVSGDFRTRTDRLHSPERVYFDILNARPLIEGKAFWSKEINDKLVQKVRAAETQPGTTRIVVVDLAGGVQKSPVHKLSKPNRLVIELRATGTPVVTTSAGPVPEPQVPSQNRSPRPLATELLPVSKAETRAGAACRTGEGAVETCVGQVGPGQVGPGQVGPGQVGSGQVGCGEVRIREDRAGEDRAGKVPQGFGEVGLGKVGPAREVGPGKVGLGKVGLGKVWNQ